MERNGLCALIGAMVGAGATYLIIQNKDQIVGEFEKLENRFEDGLKDRSATIEKAKDMYKRVSDNVHQTIEKMQAMLHGKENSGDIDKEQLLRELSALKDKVERL